MRTKLVSLMLLFAASFTTAHAETGNTVNAMNESSTNNTVETTATVQESQENPTKSTAATAKKKMLLVIDCQYDFITGSLAAPNSEPVMKNLAKYISDNDSEYAVKVFTTDWHPYNHCSFKPQGGLWPAHCVQHTKGAAIYEDITNAAFATKGDVYVFEKGEKQEVDEYSIFDNAVSAQKIREVVKKYGIEEIDICGIATEYCVKGSLEGAIKEFGPQMMAVLVNYICPISDPKALDPVIKQYNLKVINK